MDTLLVFQVIILTLILLTTVSSNVITLFVMAWTDYLRNINRVYMYSVTISDLCIGIFIYPFAVYYAIIDMYEYPDEHLCHLQAYMTIIFFLAGLYAMSWMNVDHYVAVRKPERYKVMMSPPRSLCWILFAWIAAVSFCCPPLISFKDTHFYSQVFVCTLYIGSEIPYFTTAGALVLLPAFVSILYTNIYLFTRGFKKKQKMYEAVLLEVSSRPRNYKMNFYITVLYVATWLPWCIVRVCSIYSKAIPAELHFFTFWLAMGNSYYKFFIYTGMSIEYRRGLRELFRQCCKCCYWGAMFERQNAGGGNQVPTRVVAKPSTSGPAPVIV